MSPFTEKEIEYLHGQQLGRLATIGSGGSPHIVPVGFRLDAEAQTIEIGGHGLSKSKKWRDLQANPQAAFAVDDLASVNPWTPRGIEIRGRAELHAEGGEQRFGGGGWDSAWFTIVPQRIISWGSKGQHSRRLDAALAPSQRHNPSARQADNRQGAQATCNLQVSVPATSCKGGHPRRFMVTHP